VTLLADTNVVLAFVRDLPESQQIALDSALERLSPDRPLLVVESVLAECACVLRSAYGLTPPEIVDTLELLLSGPVLLAWDPDVVADALGVMRADPGLDVTDCLLAARARVRGDTVVTFDSRLQSVLRRVDAEDEPRG
jgi:predicted nucleic acid-binding protein